MNIQSEIVDLDTPTGVMRTYIHRPVGEGKYPTVLFYSEIFQQTGPIERSARLIASHGYVVLVPEVFHELNPIGTALGYDDAGIEKGNTDKATKDVQGYDTDNRVLLDFAKQQDWFNDIVGAMGFCVGGHLAFRASLNPEVKGAVCFYPTDLHKQVIPCATGQHSMERLQDIKGELLFIWGRQDPHVPGEGRADVYKKLTEADITFTWHEFNEPHAFMRDEGPRYNGQTATLCYQLALNLLSRTLR